MDEANGSTGPAGPADGAGPGLVVVRRLHRLVRHGYRPWLGYDAASRADRDIHLRRRDGTATLYPDGSLAITGSAGGATAIAGEDAAGFDALFSPDTPNRRNLMRRLYEIGVLAR